MRAAERIGYRHVLPFRNAAARSCTRNAAIAAAVAGFVSFCNAGSAATFTTSAVAPTDSTVQISQPDNSGSSTPSNYRDFSDNNIGAGQTFTPLTNFLMTSFTFEGGGVAGGDLTGPWTIYIGSLNNGNYYSAPVTLISTETADGGPIATDVANGITTNYDTVTLATPIAVNAGTLYYWAVHSPNGYYQLAGTPTASGTYNQNSTSTEYTGGESAQYGNGGDNATPPGNQIFNLQNADRTFFISGSVATSTSASWATNGNGTYETAANWSNKSVPKFTGDTATFDSDGGTVTGSPIVTLSTPVTIDSITFNATSGGGGYTIAQGGNGQINCGLTVNAFSGTHVVNVPFNLINNYNENPAANITVGSGASLTFSNLSGGSYGNVNVTGGGSLTVDKFTTWNLTLNGATLTTSVGGSETSGGYDNFSNNAVLNVNTMVEIKQLYDDGSDQINIGSSGEILTEVGGCYIQGSVSGSGTFAAGAGTDGSANGQGITQLTGNNINFSGPITVTNSWILRAGSQNNAVTDAMLGNGSSTNSITLDNGTLALGNGNLTTPTTVTGNQPIIVNAGGGTIDSSNGGSNAAPVNLGVGSISGPGTLQVIGGGTLTVNAAVVAANASGGVRALSLGGLNINTGGVVLTSPTLESNRTVLVTGGLSLSGTTGAWTATVDLGGNDLIVQNGNLSTTVNQLKQGYAGGTWQGSGGLLSSAAAANTTHLTTVGVIQNSVDGTSSGTVLHPTFDGVTSTDADVLIKYTYYGDANLDGKVDGSDYSRIDAGFLDHATGWFNGDFNNDGVVNGSDYTLIDNAFNTQGAALSDLVASPSAVVTAQIDGSAASAVPEPASLGLFGISAAALLGRKRGRRHC
jgi:hypothetical protein